MATDNKEDSLRRFYREVYTPPISSFEEAQRKYDAKVEEVAKLEGKYEDALRGHVMQIHTDEDVRLAARKFHTAQQELKELDLKCHELKGIDLND